MTRPVTSNSDPMRHCVLPDNFSGTVEQSIRWACVCVKSTAVISKDDKTVPYVTQRSPEMYESGLLGLSVWVYTSRRNMQLSSVGCRRQSSVVVCSWLLSTDTAASSVNRAKILWKKTVFKNSNLALTTGKNGWSIPASEQQEMPEARLAMSDCRASCARGLLYSSCTVHVGVFVAS